MKDVVIFFDLFDTLIKVDRGYLEEYFDEELDKMGDLGTLKDAKSTIEQIVSKHPEVLEKHSLEEMTTYYEKIMSDSLMNVEPDILVMLQQLKEAGYKMCIVSDATFVDIKDYKKSPLFKYFDYAVFSCDYGVTKPDKRIYRIASNAMGGAEVSIFVGDAGHDELVGAKENGMTTIKTEWFIKRTDFNSVDYVTNLPSFLVNLVNKIVEKSTKDK